MDEYPEISQADLDRAVLRKNFQPVSKKQRISILLDAWVVDYFKTKAGKQGYQRLINETLKKIVKSDSADENSLEAMLRKIIREELASVSQNR